MDIAVVGLQVDTSGVKSGTDQGISALDKLEAKADRTVNHVQQKFRQLNSLPASFGKDFLPDADRLDPFSDSAEAKIKAMRDQFKNLGAELSVTKKKIQEYKDTLPELDQANEKTRRSTSLAQHAVRNFIVELGRGDPIEAFIESFGAAGPAALGFAAGMLVAGAAIVGFIAATVKASSATLTFVKDISQLERETKISGDTLLALKVIADASGQTLNDLADKYRNNSSEIDKFNTLVKATGATLDGDIKNKARTASLEFELFKLRVIGAAIAFSREFLPALTVGLRVVGAAITSLSPVWESMGRVARAVLVGLIAFVKAVADQVRVLKETIDLVRQGEFSKAFDKVTTEGSIDAFLTKAKTEAISLNRQINAASKETLSLPVAPVGRSKTGRVDNSAEQERKAIFDARVRIAQQEAQAFLEIERARIEAEKDLNDQRFNDGLVSTTKYYDARIKLVNEAVDAELRAERALLAVDEGRLVRAEKVSEKLQIQADIISRQARITAIETGREGKISKEIDAEAQAARRLNDEYKRLQEQIIQLSGSDLEKFDSSLRKTTEDLEKLAKQAGRDDILRLIEQFKNLSEVDFNRGQLDKGFDIKAAELNLERDRIQQLVVKGVISEARAKELILDLENQKKAQLLEILDLQIAEAEAAGDTLRVLQLQAQVLDVELLGVNTEAKRRFRELGQDIKDIFGDAFQTALVDGPKAGLRQLLGDFARFFSDIARQLIISGLTKLLGGILGSIGGGLGFGGFGGGNGISSSGFGGSFGGFFEFADGGNFPAGAKMLVGERGPELVKFNRAGSVINTETLLAALTGRQFEQGLAAPQVTIILPNVARPQEFAASQDQIARSAQQAFSRAFRNQ